MRDDCSSFAAARGAPKYMTADAFPPWAVALDYLLGAMMWTLIGRAGMNIFLREDSGFFFMRFFVRATEPLLRAFAPITPAFLARPLLPLYVAWFFYMFRFYLLPLLLGYSAFGVLSFPLEGAVAAVIYDIYKNLAAYF